MDSEYQQQLRKVMTIATVILGILCCCLFVYLYEYRAPKNFPDPGIVNIPEGMSESAVAKLLERDHVIRSHFWFTNFVLLFKGERTIVGGEYYFEQPLSVFGIAQRITKGDFNTDQLKTTIPEGSSVADISLILKKQYPNFDTVHFITIATPEEGYLFPNTYKFGADVTPENVVAKMKAEFDQQILAPGVAAAIASSTRSLGQIVSMASILEGEARQTHTRQIVAGILWKRFDDGMPLQVDSTLRFITGKTSAELTQSDLKIDSPYNTYINKGLPPTPISNPGIDSIMDAAQPIATNYWFFLTDANGTMHYATTLQEHDANKTKYLSQ